MDRELLEQLQLAREGNVQAFGYVATAFQGQVLAWARGYAAHLAEDIAQQALLAAFTRLHQLHEPRAFPGWLKALVRTAALRQLRRRDRLEDPGEHAGADEPLLRAEIVAAVRGAIAGLSAGQQAVAEQHYLAGRSLAEIAGALKLPLGTVKRRLFEAREKLRGKLIGFAPRTDL